MKTYAFQGFVNSTENRSLSSSTRTLEGRRQYGLEQKHRNFFIDFQLHFPKILCQPLFLNHAKHIIDFLFATSLQINWNSSHRLNWLLPRTTSHSCDELAQFLQHLERNFEFICKCQYAIIVSSVLAKTFLKLLSFGLFDAVCYTRMKTICSHIAICLLLSPDETFSQNYSPFLFFFYCSWAKWKYHSQ